MNASEGPSPRAMAASTSREVVTWMSSETLWVWSHWPPGRCSTKPRSVCTGPPRSTGCSAICSLEGSSFICDSTSESFIGRGLLSTMPSAPLSVCSQMRATVWAKFGSLSCGIAIKRWLVRLPAPPSANTGEPLPGSLGETVSGVLAPPVVCLRTISTVWARRARVSRNRRHRPRTRTAADEAPLVGKTQHAVLGRELRRKRVEGTGELEDRKRRLVELRIAARAADEGAVESAVGIDANLNDGTRGVGGGARRGGVVEGADPLDLAPPCIEIRRERGRTGIGGHPQLIALRPLECRRPRLVLRPRLGHRWLIDQQRLVVVIAAGACIGEVANTRHPGGGREQPLGRGARTVGDLFQRTALRGPGVLERRQRRFGTAWRYGLDCVARADLRALREIGGRGVVARFRKLVRHQENLHSRGALFIACLRVERDAEDHQPVQQGDQKHHRQKAVPRRGLAFAQRECPARHGSGSRPWLRL